jgi:hypothetical protein
VRRKLSLLPLTLLMLVSSALPAFAADEPVYTGTFQGLAYAGIAGIVLGIVYFLMLPADSTGGDHDDHHEAPRVDP